MLNFAGNDWCGFCIKLDKEVFNTPEFKEWAKENVILVELDFPRNKEQEQAIKKQNKALMELLDVQGYPTIWFVKPTKEGKNLEQLGVNTGYNSGGASEWLKKANEIIANYKKDNLTIASKSGLTKQK